MALNFFAGRVMDAVAESGDDAREQLRKALLLGAVLAFTPVVVPWIVLHIVYGEMAAAAISLFYLLASWTSTVIYLRTRRFQILLLSHQLLILLLPFLFLLVLGGFAGASVVILWAVICPLGTLIVANGRYARGWLLAYLSLLVLSGILQPYLRPSNSLPPAMVIAFFILNVGVVSVLVFTLLYYFVKENEKAYRLLSQEQERSERLLLNILPQPIARILKQGEQTIADSFESASILFVDLVDFTPLSAELSPDETVSLLNTVFCQFDMLMDKYRVEKIRTIGDSYMVAAGIPHPRPDHAHALAAVALEMGAFLDQFQTAGGRQLRYRIGINSGPVVAGVIGQKKFQYDVWGDTVNLASRMESHGLPGRIQIGPTTYELLKREFVCERRGPIEIKGKGVMETWFLDRPSAASGPPPDDLQQR